MCVVTRRRNLPKLRLQAGRQGIRGVLNWHNTCEISVGWIPGVWGYLIFHLASNPVCGSLA